MGFQEKWKEANIIHVDYVLSLNNSKFGKYVDRLYLIEFEV